MLDSVVRDWAQKRWALANEAPLASEARMALGLEVLARETRLPESHWALRCWPQRQEWHWVWRYWPERCACQRGTGLGDAGLRGASQRIAGLGDAGRGGIWLGSEATDLEMLGAESLAKETAGLEGTGMG